MATKNQLIELAKLRQKERLIRKAVDAQITLIGKGRVSGGCWEEWADGSIGLRLSPAEYLAHFPDDVAPELRSYRGSDGKLRAYSVWPYKRLGNGVGQTNVWVNAETEVQEVVTAEDRANAAAEVVLAQEVAA